MKMKHHGTVAKRITKYPPELHKKENLLDRHKEWSSYLDIGAVFKGTLLTREEYLRVEQTYVDAVLAFCKTLSCEGLIVNSLLRLGGENVESDSLLLYYSVAEGDILKGDDIVKMVRLSLRENLWCELRCDVNPREYIHFGEDFYMFFYCGDMSPEFWRKIDALGLYVD
jgi:hypothetical protein